MTHLVEQFSHLRRSSGTATCTRRRVRHNDERHGHAKACPPWLHVLGLIAEFLGHQERDLDAPSFAKLHACARKCTYPSNVYITREKKEPFPLGGATCGALRSVTQLTSQTVFKSTRRVGFWNPPCFSHGLLFQNAIMP